MKSLQDLDIFLHTAETGSFSSTARAMGVSAAAISAAIKRLENALDTQLFIRTTRSLRLTPKGEQFLFQCKPALAQLKQAELSLHSDTEVLRAHIRLSAPSDLGRHRLLSWLDEFEHEYPHVQIDLHLSDRISNMFKESLDAAIRYGALPDSGLIALSLHADNKRVLCASPEYLARHGMPATPLDLIHHDCLCFMLDSEVHNKWQFYDPQGQIKIVQVPARHIANDGEVVRQWAKMGKGIAYKAELDIRDDLAQGALVALCPEWNTEHSPLNLIVPGRQLISPALRLLRDFIAIKLKQ